MTESFSEMFEQSLANQRIRPGMILMGLVVDVGPDVVIINVGLMRRFKIVRFHRIHLASPGLNC